MPTLPMPTNEDMRVATIKRLDLTNPMKYMSLRPVTTISAALLNTPLALINLITARQEINKASTGLPGGGEKSRDISVCAYTILSDEPLIIEDLLSDARFKDLPDIANGLKLRAYAGVPIKAPDGTHPGALCVIDYKPHTFSAKDINFLKDLSCWAELVIMYGLSRTNN